MPGDVFHEGERLHHADPCPVCLKAERSKALVHVGNGWLVCSGCDETYKPADATETWLERLSAIKRAAYEQGEENSLLQGVSLARMEGWFNFDLLAAEVTTLLEKHGTRWPDDAARILFQRDMREALERWVEESIDG